MPGRASAARESRAGSAHRGAAGWQRSSGRSCGGGTSGGATGTALTINPGLGAGQHRRPPKDQQKQEKRGAVMRQRGSASESRRERA